MIGAMTDRPIHLRQATLADCELIHRLAEEVFPETYRKILSPEQLTYMMEWMYSVPNLHKQMATDGHVYFLAYWGDEPCGYVSVQPEGQDCFHLQKIYVLPCFQGRGIGQILFTQALDYIRSVHPLPCRMELNVNRNNPALSFYRKQGMYCLKEGDFPIGNGFYMNDYIMALDLS